MRLIEFQLLTGGQPVMINPEYVVAVEPYRRGSEEGVSIQMLSNTFAAVRGTLRNVVDQLKVAV